MFYRRRGYGRYHRGSYGYRYRHRGGYRHRRGYRPFRRRYFSHIRRGRYHLAGTRL